MNERISTRTSEKIYDVLVKYANASPDPLQKEGFVYQFSIFKDKDQEFDIQCLDGSSKKFKKNGNELILSGDGDVRVNSIVRKLVENEISSTKY